MNYVKIIIFINTISDRSKHDISMVETACILLFLIATV